MKVIKSATAGSSSQHLGETFNASDLAGYMEVNIPCMESSRHPFTGDLPFLHLYWGVKWRHSVNCKRQGAVPGLTMSSADILPGHFSRGSSIPTIGHPVVHELSTSINRYISQNISDGFPTSDTQNILFLAPPTSAHQYHQSGRVILPQVMGSQSPLRQSLHHLTLLARRPDGRPNPDPRNPEVARWRRGAVFLERSKAFEATNGCEVANMNCHCTFLTSCPHEIHSGHIWQIYSSHGIGLKVRKLTGKNWKFMVKYLVSCRFSRKLTIRKKHRNIHGKRVFGPGSKSQLVCCRLKTVSWSAGSPYPVRHKSCLRSCFLYFPSFLFVFLHFRFGVLSCPFKHWEKTSQHERNQPKTLSKRWFWTLLWSQKKRNRVLNSFLVVEHYFNTILFSLPNH